jgi:MFS family permease
MWFSIWPAKIYRRYPFHPLVWYMILETALSRMAFFMAMPFVALRMHDASSSGISAIGAIIGVAPLMSTLAGFWVGHLSDRIGRRQIIVISLYLWSGVLWGFSMAHRPMEFAVLMGLNGLLRGVFEPVTTALISDLCLTADQGKKLQKHAFHFRYFAINVGSSVGPLLGATFLIQSPTLGFRLAALVWFASACLFWALSKFWKIRNVESQREKASHSLGMALKVFTRDRALRVFLLAAFLLSFAYSQIESIFAIHLKDQYGAPGVLLFGRLLSLNGVTVVALTLPLLAWVKKFELRLSCAVSALFFAVGYFFMGLSRTQPEYMASMIVLTIGEIVIFANGNLIIESLAPPKMKGAYLGLANISSVGFVVGPALGGVLLEKGGGFLLFATLSLVMLVVSLLYFFSRGLFRESYE